MYYTEIFRHFSHYILWDYEPLEHQFGIKIHKYSV